jgi:hypothetical protein
MSNLTLTKRGVPATHDRRSVLLMFAFAAAGANTNLLFRPSGAFAADLSPTSALSVTQKILLDGVLYDNIPAYLAFAQTVQSNIKGGAAVAAYDSALNQISSFSPADLEQQLNQAIASRIGIDIVVSVTGGSGPLSLPQILQSTIPQLGVAQTLARQVGNLVAQGGPGIATVNSVLQSIQNLQLIPAVPQDISPIYWQDGLTLLQGSGGLTSLLATATNLLANGQSTVDQISSGITSVTSAISQIGDVDSTDYAAAASALASAVGALGSATHMNPNTVKEISRTVSVMGSMLSGATAGATLGPYGAAAGAIVGLLGSLFGGNGGSDGTSQALAQISSQLSNLEQASSRLPRGFPRYPAKFRPTSRRCRPRSRVSRRRCNKVCLTSTPGSRPARSTSFNPWSTSWSTMRARTKSSTASPG